MSDYTCIICSQTKSGEPVATGVSCRTSPSNEGGCKSGGVCSVCAEKLGIEPDDDSKLPDEKMKRWGENFARERRNREFTLREVWEETGKKFPIKTLSEIERGLAKPDQNTRTELAAAIGLSPKTMLDLFNEEYTVTDYDE